MTVTRQPMGWEHALGLAKETTWGTEVAPSQWVPGTCKVKKDPGIQLVDLPIGELDRTHTTLAGIRVAGPITYPLCPGRCDEFADMLTLKDDVHLESFSVLEHHNDEFAKMHLGIVVVTARITCEAGGDEGGGNLVAELDTIGKDGTKYTTARTPNYTSQPAAFTFHELVTKRDTVEFKDKRKVEIAIRHIFKTDKWDTSSRTLRDLPLAGREIEIDLGLDFEDEGWYDDYMAGTEFALDLKWTRAANNIGFAFPRCIIGEGADPEQTDKPNADEIEPKIHALKPEGADIMTVSVDAA